MQALLFHVEVLDAITDRPDLAMPRRKSRRYVKPVLLVLALLLFSILGYVVWITTSAKKGKRIEL